MDEANIEPDQVQKKATQISKRILISQGLNNTYIILKSDNLEPNAKALYRNETQNSKVILYNPAFIGLIIANQNNWEALFILAHEIGHHINEHTLKNYNQITPTQRRQYELEADNWATIALCHMGAKLNDVLSGVNSCRGIEPEYPSKANRQENIRNTYRNCNPPNEPSVDDNFLINVNGYNQINIQSLKPDSHNNNTIWDVTQFNSKEPAKKLLECVEGNYFLDLDIPPKDFSILRNNSSMQIQAQNETILSVTLKIDILYKRQGLSRMEYFQVKGSATGTLNIQTNSDKRHINFWHEFAGSQTKKAVEVDKFPKLWINEIPLNGEFTYNSGSRENQFDSYKTKVWSNNSLTIENNASGVWMGSIFPYDIDNDAMSDLKFFRQ